MVWEPMKYLIFLITSYKQRNCTLSEEKENVHMFVRSSIQTKKAEYENYAKEPCLEPYQISMMEHFCENIKVKSC